MNSETEKREVISWKSSDDFIYPTGAGKKKDVDMWLVESRNFRRWWFSWMEFIVCRRFSFMHRDDFLFVFCDFL